MSVHKKLFKAKQEIGKLTKDSKNPFFKSNYLSLNGLIEAVEEVLVKHYLLLLQPIAEGMVITKIIDTDCESGEVEVVTSSIALPNIQDPQKLGSAITYYRRYTLQSLLGLQAEDDDGNSATKHVNKPIKQELDAKGLAFLINRGTIKQIEECFTLREVSDIQKTELNKKLAELKAK